MVSNQLVELTVLASPLLFPFNVTLYRSLSLYLYTYISTFLSLSLLVCLTSSCHALALCFMFLEEGVLAIFSDVDGAAESIDDLTCPGVKVFKGREGGEGEGVR